MTLPTVSLDILHCIHKACDFKTRRVFQEALGWKADALPYCPVLSKEVEMFLVCPNSDRYEDAPSNTIHRCWGKRNGNYIYHHFLEFCGSILWQREGTRWIIPDPFPWLRTSRIIEQMDCWSDVKKQYDTLFYADSYVFPMGSSILDTFARGIPRRNDGKAIFIDGIDPLTGDLFPSVWHGDLEVDMVYTCTRCKLVSLGKLFIINVDGTEQKSGRCVSFSSTTNEKIFHGIPGYGYSILPMEEVPSGPIAISGPYRGMPLDVRCGHEWE